MAGNEEEGERTASSIRSIFQAKACQGPLLFLINLVRCRTQLLEQF